MNWNGADVAVVADLKKGPVECIGRDPFYVGSFSFFDFRWMVVLFVVIDWMEGVAEEEACGYRRCCCW